MVEKAELTKVNELYETIFDAEFLLCSNFIGYPVI